MVSGGSESEARPAVCRDGEGRGSGGERNRSGPSTEKLCARPHPQHFTPVSLFHPHSSDVRKLGPKEMEPLALSLTESGD